MQRPDTHYIYTRTMYRIVTSLDGDDDDDDDDSQVCVPVIQLWFEYMLSIVVRRADKCHDLSRRKHGVYVGGTGLQS